MNKETILISIIFFPLFGSIVLPFLGIVSQKARNLLAFLFVFASFVLSLVIMPAILSGQEIKVAINLPLGFNFVLNADGLAIFMALVSSFISAIILLYSWDYISHYENQNEYYFMVVLFLGAMMGLVFSGNLILMYIFWEVTAFTSWRLIGFFRNKEHVVGADKAFLITISGALFMLLGFIRLYNEVGSFDLSVIKQAMTTQAITGGTVCLILLGILSKSATLPFHTWLPDAGVAPSPVTALLHAAVLVKIGVYVFARIFVVTVPLDINWNMIVAIIAGLSALVSAGAALIDNNLKRIIAYSTISQIGFIFLGLATQNTIGLAGGLLYILMHGLGKAGLFLCAGIVEQNNKTKDITELGGLIKTMPLTAIAFLFCAFSIMGIPPFGGFFSKYLVIAGAFQTGNLTLAFSFLFIAILTIVYLFRAFTFVFLGEPKRELVKEGSKVMVACVLLFAILSLAGGIFIKYPSLFVQFIVEKILGA